MLSRGKEHATLRAAYELLERATKLRVPCDEVRMYQLLEPKNEEVVVHLCWEKLSSFYVEPWQEARYTSRRVPAVTAGLAGGNLSRDEYLSVF